MDGATAQKHEASAGFYRSVLEILLADGTLNRRDNILVVCGDTTDRRVFLDAGFKNVTISNVDERLRARGEKPFAPYAWRRLDARQLDLPDACYDFAVVHSGLHHLDCPPKGLAEMLRVAGKGVIGFEPCKNIFTALGIRLGFGQEYEKAAVFDNECKRGGANNSEIPNYVYRFRKDDIKRTVQASSPICRYRYRYWFATRMPARLQNVRNPLVRFTARAGGGFFEFMGRHFPCLANNMAFAVIKPANLESGLFPWLKINNGRVTVNANYS